MTGIKICGITTAESYAAARSADYVGFVFYPPSPRAVTAEQARDILASSQKQATSVGVFVDASAADIHATVTIAGLDAVQLHGAEDTDFIIALKQQLPPSVTVIKAARVSSGDDIAHALSFAPHVDMLLLDAKPPKDALLPGGNGVRFDWTILHGRNLPLPWFLAGGIGAEHLNEAVNITGAPFVDVSSSVEDAPGEKNPCAVREIIAQAHALSYRH